MERRFFSMKMDVYLKGGRWRLDDLVDARGQPLEDPWRFGQGKPVGLQERLRVPVEQPGEPLDIAFAGTGLTPIVAERVATLFRELASDDVQLFPVDVEGQSQPYFILNVAREIRGIDDAACREVQRITADEPLHAELVGQYRSVIGLRIDRAKVGEARVFRLWGWPTPIIVDEELKEALEANGVFGAKFDEV
ncbi:imm11 family protein [Myxococcus faecalis]|uniref:imm11 family protein n=1 Tax=Myxococcus faecalis TaxID=3115646 RepID=UPI003CF7E3BA